MFVEFSAYTQVIQLYSNADLSTVTANGKKYQQFRYMIFPGNGAAKSADRVNWADYAAAKTYLRLND
ncbi:hypothetical protein [Chitinophaga caseinilytica]|uniref:Uncharacterized protein n=1 Tax=Chitinophaga caseinilytica TaxID=2267521 RepID=A0ABZ2ZA76_9BACT